ncbi:hypothetical protein SEA_JAMZY_60 [Gordonia phage Jamzy]|nr:hypothetical protein SEA_JAMZY_60 [Gordonia phage Jamzy]
MGAQKRPQGRHTRLPYGRAHGQVMVEDLGLMRQGPWGQFTVMGRKISDVLHANALVATPTSHRADYTLVQEP